MVRGAPFRNLPLTRILVGLLETASKPTQIIRRSSVVIGSRRKKKAGRAPSAGADGLLTPLVRFANRYRPLGEAPPLPALPPAAFWLVRVWGAMLGRAGDGVVAPADEPGVALLGVVVPGSGVVGAVLGAVPD